MTRILSSASLPRHIAIVMDGNGRWAERRGRLRTLGHRAGTRAVNLCIDYCLERGIEALTLFAFSSENWRRPEQEVGALMQLFMRALDREVEELARRGVRLRFIGERAAFTSGLRMRMDAAEYATRGNTRLHLTIAANYGGRWDIAQAARSVALDVEAKRLSAEAVDIGVLSSYLCLSDLPEPDLFIRTGGDYRISNFLLWQLAYCELWFTETLWPDVDKVLLDAALSDYGQRQRRFGGTGAQVAAITGTPP